MSFSAALFVIAFVCLMLGWVSAAIWLAFAAGCVLFLWSVRVVCEMIFGPFLPGRR